MDQVSTPHTISYRPLYLHFGRFLISCILTFILTPIANAHQSVDQGLAPSLSKALAKAKVKTVVVFNFKGPDEKVTQLGQDFADKFRSALAKSGGNFVIVDRAEVQAVVEKNRVAPEVIRDPEIAWWLARQLKADALIVGELTPLSGELLKFAVAAAKTKDGKNVADLWVTVPFTDEMKALVSKSLVEDRPESRMPPGTPPNLYPQCVYCPRADFSAEAMANKQQGIVTLVVVIGLDGRASDIDFVKGQPYGLTQKAIEAVRSWKFKPAQTPEGNPRAVRQVIEVTFHLTN